MEITFEFLILNLKIDGEKDQQDIIKKNCKNQKIKILNKNGQFSRSGKKISADTE